MRVGDLHLGDLMRLRYAYGAYLVYGNRDTDVSFERRIVITGATDGPIPSLYGYAGTAFDPVFWLCGVA